MLATSCSIDLGYIQLFREAILENRIEVSDDFKAQIPASFIKASKGKNDAILVLSNSVNGIDTWIGANQERIVTFKGLILETSNLEFNINFYNFDEIEEFYLKNNFITTASLSKPEYKYAEISFNFKDVSFSDSCSKLYFIERVIEFINFKSNDQVCFSENYAQWSRQKINPFDEYIFIEYHYKF